MQLSWEREPFCGGLTILLKHEMDMLDSKTVSCSSTSPSSTCDMNDLLAELLRANSHVYSRQPAQDRGRLGRSRQEVSSG